MLTIITPTGDRQDAFSLCQKFMAAQDYAGAVRWVIVDDGHNPTEISFKREGWDIQVIRPNPCKGVTQVRNLLMGMAFVPAGGRVSIVEDDDAYAPGYLSAACGWLEAADLVGEKFTRYYNVKTGRGQRMKNDKHASLCSTSMKGMATEFFVDLLSRQVRHVDMALWAEYPGRKFLSDTAHVTGIKGMPGRPGIGVGHQESFGTPMPLRDWLGDDARLYAQ